VSETAAALDGIVISESARKRLEEFRLAHETRVLTIFFSDLVGSTRLQSDQGNLRATEIVGKHQAVVRHLLRGFDGREVDTQGDSFLLVFAAPSEGVRFALRLMAAMRTARAEEPALPEVRVGLHQGQVVVDQAAQGTKVFDVYGLQVSTAARIMDLAAGGQILCSRAVFDDARAILTKADLDGLAPVAWRNHDSYHFKGVADAHQVCEVGEEGLAPLHPPPAGAKGWPVAAGDEELGWRPAAGVVVPGTSWILESKLGEGGFGEVWKAVNRADLSTQVFKFCFRRDRLPALKREARLLKRLRLHAHPSLVQVHDVTEGDRPPYFLEMEYVDGPPVKAWLEGAPPLADRLEVVAQVADALDVVHAAGITHRDVKPSNLLLTRRGDGALLAKLSDFGLGAAEDEDLLKSLSASRSDGLVGTSDYLAPERRAGGAATPQSDLYALGLTLYQIVVGDVARALPIDWEARLPDEVVRDDVRRSIATDPAGRWRHAGELAKALRAHDGRLAQRALERAHAAAVARAARLRRLVAGVALGAGAVLGLGGVAVWKWVEADRHLAEAERQRDLARAQKQLALEGIARLTHDVPERLRDVPGALTVVRDVVAGNLAMLDRVLALEPDSSVARREKFANHVAAGDAWRQLGDTAKAAEAYESAIALASRLALEAPGERAAVWNHTLALERLGDVRARQGRGDDSLRAYEQSLTLARTVLSVNLEAPGARADLAGALGKAAGAYLALGRTAEAEAALREATALEEARSKAAPADTDAMRALGVAYEREGDLDMSLSRPADALRRYEASQQICERLARMGPDRPALLRDLSVGLDKIGRALQALGRAEEALPRYEESLRIVERLAAADPGNVELERDVGVGHDRLGDLLLAAGKTEEARDAYQKGMKVGERLAAADPTNARAQLDLSTGWLNLGAVELGAQRPEAARAAYLRALAISETVSARDPGNAEALRHVGVSASKVGNSWIAEGRPEEALPLYERAAAVARRQVAADPRSLLARRDVGVAGYYAMVTLAALGRLAPWREAATESLEAFRAIHAASGDDRAAAADLALALETSAADAFGFEGLEPSDVELALGRARERVALKGRETPDAYIVLSDVARRADAPGEAEDALRKALALLDASPDAEAKAAKRAAIAAKLDEFRASRSR